MTPRIFCGNFEAEVYWREPDLAQLPALPDPNAARIVAAMDEMLFVFCGPGDSVLTRRRMNDAHEQYLRQLGFRFLRNRFDLAPTDDGAASPAESTSTSTSTSTGLCAEPSVFQYLLQNRLAESLKPFLTDGARLEPFAVLPGTIELARQYRLDGVFPSQSVVRGVNTKSYSLRMRDRLGIPNVGVVADSVEALLEAGAKLLAGGPFLIKDDYGVSGKGNQLIESDRALQRIGRYLAGQVANGKRVSFVLEPFLKKSADFSCQFRIDEHGAVTVFCVQELRNHGLAFGGSYDARPQLLEQLHRERYFELMESVGRLLFGDGYCGDVCVDSMILEDGTLAPLVEINARKSMSLIKHAIDRHLDGSARRACLTQIAAVNDGAVSFSALLERLDDAQLLVTAQRESGVLPLTAGTLFPDTLAGPVKGRLYLAAVHRESATEDNWLPAASHAMAQAGLRVMH